MTLDVRRRNNVIVVGEGPPLVFAHGFGCDHSMWKRVAPRFVESHTVVTFDYVGTGKSERSAYDPARYRTLDGYAEDLVEICRTLDLANVCFVGHSVSTMIGVRAALAAPGLFERMVMLAPSPSFINDPPYVGGFERADVEGLLSLMDANFMGWADAVSQMALTVPELARELRETFCSADPRSLREFAHAAFLTDSRALLPALETPCLVVQCARDDLAPIVVGEYVAATLPHARYALVDVPGHMPHMSHPDEVTRLVADFCREPADRLAAS